MKKNYFTEKLNRGLIAFTLVFCAFMTNSVVAQKNIAWTGATDNNWSTASNWNYPAITITGTFAANAEINYIAPFAANVTEVVIAGNRTNLVVGLRVSGTGISAGTTVTAAVISGDKTTTTITISQPTTLASEGAGNNLLFQSNTNITLDAGTTSLAINEISIGDKVSAFGIPQGATVTAIDVTKKIITINSNTFAGVGTPGTNVIFTFSTPKIASSPPTILDIAVINNGGNPTLTLDEYFVAGLIIGNNNTNGTASTLTIPSNVIFYVDTNTNEGVLVKGGNIINNGILEIKSGLSGGSNNTAGAYGMVFGLPFVVPTIATEYTYSGSGELTIDTSLGNNFSGGFLFNGINANANLATYRLLFNGVTNFKLSPATATNGTATTHLIRAIGAGALNACKVVIGGAGFDFGTEDTGITNGLLSTSGSGVDVTIDQGTTIKMFSNIANPTTTFGMYSFGSTAVPSFIRNNGTVIIKGSMQRSPLGLSAQNMAIVNFVNNGILDIDVKSVLAGNAGVSITNNGGATQQAVVNLINTGTMSIKSYLNGACWGAPIVMTTFSGAPNLLIDNSGTLNLMGSNYSFGSKVFDPNGNTVTTITGASRITNSGTINTNQELRTFYTINTSTGKITFLSSPENTTKLITFNGVTATINASIGTTYTDLNSNVYTIVVNKTGTGTTLVAHVDAGVFNTPSSNPVDSTLLPTLTKTGEGAGDAIITYTGNAATFTPAFTTNGQKALFQPTSNSGVINTNTGSTGMTGIDGVTTVSPTSVLSPGGDTGKGVATFGEAPADTFSLKGTIKMQISGNTTAGVDYDKIVFPGKSDVIDISEATLDVTGIYTPTSDVTVDILTTYVDPVDPLSTNSGALLNGGSFANVIGLTSGWKVNYVDIIGGKVQLSFDPNLSTSDNAFSKFKFNYYPNPTSNLVNLSAEKNISKVELYTITGQKVQSNTVNASQKQLNISNLQRGVYLMEVSIDNAKKTFKIVKQ